jgi:hypothetical protein
MRVESMGREFGDIELMDMGPVGMEFMSWPVKTEAAAPHTPRDPEDCASENTEWSTACAATTADTIRGSPRSRPARHQPAPPITAPEAPNAHQGTVPPDIITCPRAASSTQTTANTAARTVREHHPAVMAGSSSHPGNRLHGRVRKFLTPHSCAGSTLVGRAVFTSELVGESVPPTEGEVGGTATAQQVVIGR